MPSLSSRKVAQSWAFKTAKNLPADVVRYVQEGKDSGMDEGKAWAVAWSRYCKYKNPGSDHCKKDTSEYFPGRKASLTGYRGHSAEGKVTEGLKALTKAVYSSASHKKVAQILDGMISEELPFVESSLGAYEVDPLWIRFLVDGGYGRNSLPDLFYRWVRTDPHFRALNEKLRADWNLDKEYAMDAMRGKAHDLSLFVQNVAFEFLLDEYGTSQAFEKNYGRRAQELTDQFTAGQKSQDAFARDIHHGRFASGEAEMSRTVQARLAQLAQLAQSFPAGSSDRKILQKLASKPRVAARRVPSGDIGECPPKLREKALQSFKKSMGPVVQDAVKALGASGFVVQDQGFVLDEYDSEGVVLYYFESKDRGDFYLRFSGKPEVVGEDKWKQVDVDDTEEWQEEVLCPPSKHQEVAAYNASSGKELLLRGKVTPAFVDEAFRKIGLTR